MKDFFISYNKADAHWAIGIGDWLDQAGFTTILQAQDFVPGSNFVSAMHKALQSAKRFIMVLSPDYLLAKFPEAEWTAAFSSDPTNLNRTLVPVRVRECKPLGLLRPITYIDLVGLNVEEARDKFLADITACLAGKRGALAVDAVLGVEHERTAVHQAVHGDENILVGGNFVMYQQPPNQKIVLERRDGSISAAQARQVQGWIEKLAEGTIGMGRSRAYAMWWERFKNRFRLAKYEDLAAEDYFKAKAWFKQQSAIALRGLKSKAPDAWRKARYGAIHQAMKQLGVDKQGYYWRVAQRLKIRPFLSLTQLTKRDLERVDAMARRDASNR